MKVALFQMLIVLLWSLLDISYGKIIFQPKKDYAISLVSKLFHASTNPEIDNVKVVNFGYDTANPKEFQILMKSLNEEIHSKVTLAFSDFDKTVLNPWDRVFLFLLSTNRIRETFLFINQISFKGLNSIKAIILFDGDITKEEFIKFHEKPRATNFDEIIYAFPSFAPPTGGFSHKVNSGTLVIYLENLLLTKLSSTIRFLKFQTNKYKINSTINRIGLQYKRNVDKINKFPIKVLLYLRPLSVEMDPSNSGEYKGIEINILKILTDALQSSYILELGRPEEYGNYYTNNTPTRALTDIREGRFDLSINRYPVMDSEDGMGIVPFAQEEFCFVMLMPETQLRTWSVFLPFKKSVWVSLLLINIAAYTTYLFIKKKDWKFIWLFQSWVSSVSGFPATQLSHRIFWSSWLLFNFITSAFYTSYFVTQIVRRKKSHPYETLQDLITGNITLLSEAGHFQEIWKSFTGIELTPYYGQPQHINRSSALLTARLTRLKLFKLFHSQFYTVDECLPRRTVGPLMSTIKPNFHRLVTMMHELVTAGLVQHWLDIYLNHDYLSGNRTSIDNAYEKEEYSPLKVKELVTIFHYFTLMVCTSCAVFLCEVLHFYITKPKTKSRPEIVRVYPYTD